MIYFGSFIFRSILLQIFSTSFTAICIRILFVVVVVFFLLPIFFIELSSGIGRLELCILCVISCELIAYKVQQSLIDNIGNNDQVSKKAQSNFAIHSVHEIIRNPNLCLFLYISVDIENFVPKSMYVELLLDDFLKNTIKVYDHYQKPIVAIEIDSCAQILKAINAHLLISKIFKRLRKNSSESITFIIGVQELSNAKLQKETFRKIQNCINTLSVYLNKKLDIDLILENMQTITGFSVFALFIQNINSDALTISLNVNPANPDSVCRSFEQKFTNFILMLDHFMVTTNWDNPLDAQTFQIFTQQIYYLKDTIKDLLLVVIQISRTGQFLRRNNIFIDIHFLSSSTKVMKKNDIITKDLQFCIKV